MGREAILRQEAERQMADSRETGEGIQFSIGLAASGFMVMVMGLVYKLSLANHCDSGSFLVALTSLGQDGFQQGFQEVDRMCGIFF